MGEKWGEFEEGEIQGDPMTGFLFRMAIHPYVRELDGALAVGGGMARLSVIVRRFTSYSLSEQSLHC